jgi:molybdopterin-binding protein
MHKECAIVIPNLELVTPIEKIVSDKVVLEVVIRTAAGIVTSIITTGSVERMNLKEGDNVFAVTKGDIGVSRIAVRFGA